MNYFFFFFSENKTRNNDINPDHITLSLQWILILEHLFPRIVSKNSITARYCRLSCTYLAGNLQQLFFKKAIGM